MASDFIHAEGVRFAVPSSAPQARVTCSASGMSWLSRSANWSAWRLAFACDLPAANGLAQRQKRTP
jgi:hypothetical protein